jgi:hypothetical protein
MPDHCCNASACLAALMPHGVATRLAGAAMQRPSWTNNAQQIFSAQIMIRSDHDLISLFEHDLFGKPVPTFPDHALSPAGRHILRGFSLIWLMFSPHRSN